LPNFIIIGAAKAGTTSRPSGDILMQFKKLFQRGRIGTLEVPNRIVVGPVNTGYSDGGQDRWRYTERHTRLLSGWAKSGVGLIIQAHIKVESEIDKEGAFSRYMVLDKDDWIGSLSLLTDRVHSYGAKIAIQLSAGSGRMAAPVPGFQPVGPSPNPHLMDPQLITRELTVNEIERLVEAYGEAAARAKTAGFDAIVFHCVSQLFDQFLTPCWNRRADKYGGDVKGRMRFVVECIESVKERVGSDFPLIVGMVSDHKIAGGSTLEDTIKIAKHFEEVGIHALYLRVGGYDVPAWLVPPLYMKDGCSFPSAQPIREAVNIPVIVDGKIRTPELAEMILEGGKADFVGIARPMFADPEWPKKAREGKPEDIQECIACNECITRLRNWAPLGCSVNPALGREEDCAIVPTSKPKKVLIIGGGPAGMETARVAALRGHNVSLFEKDDKLGGHLIEASAPPSKKDINSLLDRLTRQLDKLKVEIELGKKVTVETVHQLKPDVVICATGSILKVPDVPGVKSNIVTTAIDVLREKAKVGQEVVIVGGNEIGCETAAYLARMGKTVTIVRRAMEASPLDMSPFNLVPLMKVLTENKVHWVTNVDVKEIGDDRIVLIDREEAREQTLRADTVVLAKGLVADNSLYNELEGKVPELHVIGDSVKPRKIWEAMREGFSIAREI
jgi:2-enoate reductase